METVFNPATFFPAELFGSFDGLRKASAEQTKRLESLNLKFAETLMKKQAEFINHAVDTSSRVTALFGAGKALPEIVTEQFQIANEYGTRLVGLMQETGNAVMESQAGYREWMEQGYKEMGEQIKGMATEFVPAATKATRKA